MSNLEEMFNKTYKVINVFIVIKFLFVCLVSKKISIQLLKQIILNNMYINKYSWKS